MIYYELLQNLPGQLRAKTILTEKQADDIVKACTAWFIHPPYNKASYFPKWFRLIKEGE